MIVAVHGDVPSGFMPSRARARIASVRTMGSGSKRAASDSASRSAGSLAVAAARIAERRTSGLGSRIARSRAPLSCARESVRAPIARHRSSGSSTKARASSSSSFPASIRVSAASAPAASWVFMRSPSTSSSSGAHARVSRTRWRTSSGLVPRSSRSAITLPREAASSLVRSPDFSRATISFRSAFKSPLEAARMAGDPPHDAERKQSPPRKPTRDVRPIQPK